MNEIKQGEVEFNAETIQKPIFALVGAYVKLTRVGWEHTPPHPARARAITRYQSVQWWPRNRTGHDDDATTCRHLPGLSGHLPGLLLQAGRGRRDGLLAAGGQADTQGGEAPPGPAVGHHEALLPPEAAGAGLHEPA